MTIVVVGFYYRNTMYKKELEVRFKITQRKHGEIRDKLYAMGWESKESEQEDTYFCKKKYFDEQNTKDCPYVVRIRKNTGKSKLTYKSFLPDKTWIELESGIDNANAVYEILQKMDQSPYLVIKKKRISGNLDGLEINLDTIAGLGYFVELEFMSDDNHKEDVFKNTMNKLGLSKKDLIKSGYVQLLEESLLTKKKKR